MPRRRLRFRPPGVRPSTRVGPLGPFRGRLGLGWVIAPIVVGAVLAIAVWLLLFRAAAPGDTFVPVGRLSTFAEGTARAVSVPGVFVGRSGQQLFAIAQDGRCRLGFCGRRYVDCRGATFGIDGQSSSGPGALDLLPVQVYRGTVFVDPSHPVDRSPAPAPRRAAKSCP